MADIKHSLQVTASPEQVYGALTTAAGIRSWWTDNADLDEQVGGKGVFRFHYENTVETVVDIIDLQAPTLVKWSVPSSFRPEQNGTIITFQMHPEGNCTVLNFSQEGYAVADEIFALMSTGWAYYLQSLKRYFETGKGSPSPNIDPEIMAQVKASLKK
jgi:uncharacterized protein YndB with AHSA1/START domain